MTWYNKSFGKDYLDLYPHRDDVEAESDITSLTGLLPLDRTAPLLDLGCGAGRHLLALHKLGFKQLYGLDLSEHLLEVAAEALGDAGAGHVELIHGDMRHIPFEKHFKTVLSLFTSFGYFEDDTENEQVFRTVARALRPGGCFIMDFFNSNYIREHLIPENVQDLPDRRVLNRRRITPDGKRVEKTITVALSSGAEQVFHESVRLYSRTDLEVMATCNGLAIEACYGSHDGQPFGADSQRLILACRKPPTNGG